MRKSLSRICLITPDSGDAKKVEEGVRLALAAGIRWVQFRRKEGSRRELYHQALRLRELSGWFDALFIVNDYADIALAVDADGLHVGQGDLPLDVARRIMRDKIVGVSTHSVQEVLSAQRGGADYIGFGPIFPTKTKDAGKPKGPSSISDIKYIATIPVIAIGGILAGNVRALLDAGCDGVAVSSGIFAGDITANVVEFMYNGANLSDRF